MATPSEVAEVREEAVMEAVATLVVVQAKPAGQQKR